MADAIGIQIKPNRVEAVALRFAAEVECLGGMSIDYGNEEELVSALKKIAEKFEALSAVLCVGLPAEGFSFRRLTFPFSKPRAINAALKFELEGLLPFPASELEISSSILSINDSGAAEVLACATEPEFLNRYRTLLKNAGITARFLLPDVSGLYAFNEKFMGQANRILLLDADSGRLLGCYVGNNGTVDFNISPAGDDEANYFSASFSEEPEKVVCGGREGSQLYRTSVKDDGKWLTNLKNIKGVDNTIPVYPALFGLAAIAADSRSEGINFSKERGYSLKFAKGFRLQGMAVGVFLFVWISFLAFANIQRASELASAKEEIKKIFTHTLPRTKMVKPLVQLRQKVEALEKGTASETEGGGFLADLKAVSERIPDLPGARIDELNWDPRGLTINGQAASMDDVENIRSRISGLSGYGSIDLVDSRPTAKQDGVTFSMRLHQ